MNHTPIEWVKNPDGTQGYTWNPITGCLNGCEYCYARKLANTRLRERYLANKNVAPRKLVEATVEGKHYQWEDDMPDIDPFYPRFWEDRFNSFPGWREAKGVFVCDMSDLFGIGIPENWTRRVLKTIDTYPWHRFYLLTKQPQNLIKFSPFPDNCWVGVTATNADMLFDALNHLDDIQCSIRYLSLEPLLGNPHLEDLPAHLGSSVDWVIIGAMTCGGDKIAELSSKYPALTPTPYGNCYTLQPEISWVKEIVEACDKAGIPVSLKDNLGELLFEADAMWAFDTEGILRQEMPILKREE